MECYEGATMIKTFRGLIGDGEQDTIVLHTNDGSMGYRIVKFDIFPHRPGGTSHVESVVQIFKVSQDTIAAANSIVDFSDNTLVAAAYLTDDVNNASGPLQIVMFEQERFNQDIYVTHTDEAGTAKVNYYIELEQIRLDLSESTVATLKDIRNTATIGY